MSVGIVDEGEPGLAICGPKRCAELRRLSGLASGLGCLAFAPEDEAAEQRAEAGDERADLRWPVAIGGGLKTAVTVGGSGRASSREMHEPFGARRCSGWEP